jgi:hypothetical protein
MESQMVELEKNMGTISAASESVDSSLSARRGQLEKLNGAKKNLTKLQFLTDLPSRLQRCVREEQHETAVADFRKARRILRAVGHVGSFEGIEEEATLIMKRVPCGSNPRRVPAAAAAAPAPAAASPLPCRCLAAAAPLPRRCLGSSRCARADSPCIRPAPQAPRTGS